MTADSTPSDGPTEQARAYVEKAAEHGMPRRYIARRLADVNRLNQREVGELLGISLGTVNSDLSETKAPIGRTKKGTPIYQPGRFDHDPGFKERVTELQHDMSLGNARLEAAREFAGPPVAKVKAIRSTDEQKRLQAQAIKVFG